MHTAHIKGRPYGQCALSCHFVLFTLTPVSSPLEQRGRFLIFKFDPVALRFRATSSTRCFMVCRNVHDVLMLNAANETVWTSLAHKVPGAVGTDHCGYGLDGMLCAFVVSWWLTLPDIIRSQRRSKPWATAFAPHLIIPRHYSNGGLLKHALPYQRLLPLPSPKHTRYYTD